MHGFQMGFVVPAAVVETTYVGSSSAVAASGSVTWPAGTQVGDLAFIMAYGFNSASITPTTGYTIHRTGFTDSGEPAAWAIYSKILTAGDISTPPSFTNGGSGGAVWMTLRNAPNIAMKNYIENSTNDIFAGFTKSANCMQIIAVCSASAPSAGNITPPAGFTERIEPSVGLFDNAFATAKPEDYTNNNNMSFFGIDHTHGCGQASFEITSTVPLVPVISVAPVVSGVLTQGSVLSCTTGTWTNSPSSYTYQWVRLPSTNVGTDSSTYATVPGDVTNNIKCQVTATNASGSSSPADSNTVGPITAAGPWTPADLVGLIAWYKADTGVTHSSGAVSQWADQSGNNKHLVQATGTNQPTYSATSFNGLTGITFDGIDNYLLATDIAQGGGDKLSCFIAARKIALVSSYDRWIIWWYPPALANDYENPLNAIVFCNSATDPVLTGFRGGFLDDYQTITTGTNYRFGSCFDGTNHTLYVNNVSDGTPVPSSGNFGSPASLYVGAGFVSGGVSTFSNICLAEIVVTNTAISSTDRDNLDNYFKTKWGLT